MRYPAGYGDIRPRADYKPWTIDEEFRAIYSRIASHTMVDVYRLYSLYRLLGQLGDVQGDVVEVGVWRGGSAALLATVAAQRFERDVRVFAADTFRGVVKAGPRDEYYKGGEHANTSAAIVDELLTSIDRDNVTILEGVFPDETGAQVADRSFRFCHIDVDVYRSAADVFEWVWPRLSIGGIVVFDDYGFYGCEGVTRYVDEDVAVRADARWVYNLNGQAVVVRVG